MSTTITTTDQFWFTTFMQPPKNSKICKYLQKARHLSSNESFIKRHFVNNGYGLLAFAQSFFETFTYTGKCLENCFIDIWHMDFRDFLNNLKNNSLDALHSLKYTICMPFILFAGLFFPSIYEVMDYPYVDAQETMQNLRNDLQNDALIMAARERDDLEGRHEAAIKGFDDITNQLNAARNEVAALTAHFDQLFEMTEKDAETIDKLIKQLQTKNNDIEDLKDSNSR